MSTSKILIIADLEGCMGVTDAENDALCKQKREKELEAIRNGLKTKGSFEIFYYDCHSNMMKTYLRNLDGITYLRNIWEIDYSQGYECALLIGFHCREGAKGFLPHSFRKEFTNILLGDKDIGEIGLFTNWLSYYSIPVVLISGDVGILEETKDIDCVKFITKSIEGISPYSQEHMFKMLEDAVSILFPVTKHSSYKYSPDPVTLEFRPSKLSSALSKIGIVTSGNKAYFENTITFFNELIRLCRMLNLVRLQKRLMFSEHFLDETGETVSSWRNR